MRTLAAALDATHGCTDYSAALREARALMLRPSAPLCPGAGLPWCEHASSFESFAFHQSDPCRPRHLLNFTLTAEQQARYII